MKLEGLITLRLPTCRFLKIRGAFLETMIVTLLLTRNNIARRLAEAGRIEQAIGTYESLIADQRRVLGHDHPDSVGAQKESDMLVARAGY